MPKPGSNIAVKVSEDEVLAAIFKVKPTADMPRPGAQPFKAKKAAKRKAKRTK